MADWTLIIFSSFTKMPCYQNVLLPKCPITKKSFYRNVLLPKCPLPKCPLPKCPLPKCHGSVTWRTQINLAVSWVCHRCYACVKRAVCSNLCHNNIILLPYFLLLSEIQKMLWCSCMQDQTFVFCLPYFL